MKGKTCIIAEYCDDSVSIEDLSDFFGSHYQICQIYMAVSIADLLDLFGYKTGLSPSRITSNL